MTATLDQVDITDPALYADGDPHAVFSHLRRHRPVFLHEPADRPPYWVLTRHDDQVRVHRNPGIFSTEWGVTFDTLREKGRDPAAGKMLEMSPPAHHRLLRRELNKSYNRSAMARLESQVRDYATEVVDTALAKPEFDFAADVADPMTSGVVFGLLGLPRADWGMLFDLSRRSQEETHPSVPVRSPFHTSAQEANQALLKYYLRLLDPRHDGQTAGHLRMLTSLRPNGNTLNQEEVILTALNIMQGKREWRAAYEQVIRPRLEHMPGEGVGDR